MFTTRESLRNIASADTLSFDDNFSLAQVFKQLFVIRVSFADTAITTTGCVLLSNKTRATYEELFQAVVDKRAESGFDLNMQT